MKKLFNSLRGKNTLCVLCLALATAVLTYRGSFIFLGEPEIPEGLRED